MNVEKLNNVKLFLLDMDGTIYLSDTLIDGADDFLDTLTEKEKDFLFLTNNSSKDSLDYVAKLDALGINVDQARVLTSGHATIKYLHAQYLHAQYLHAQYLHARQPEKQPSVFLLGTPSLERQFRDGGIQLVNGTESTPDYVVLGFDTTLTYEKIWQACDLLNQGVPFIATHPDFVCPLKDRHGMPDTGAMIRMFEAATGCSPEVIGKPNRYMVDLIAKEQGLDKSEIAIVGDRLYTDVKMGMDSGIVSVLVLSGETTEDMLQATDGINPDYVFSSVDELATKLR